MKYKYQCTSWYSSISISALVSHLYGFPTGCLNCFTLFGASLTGIGAVVPSLYAVGLSLYAVVPSLYAVGLLLYAVVPSIYMLWVCHYMLWFRHHTLFLYDNSSLLWQLFLIMITLLYDNSFYDEVKFRFFSTDIWCISGHRCFSILPCLCNQCALYVSSMQKTLCYRPSQRREFCYL